MKKTVIILIIIFLAVIVGSVYIIWDIFKDIIVLAK